MAYSILETFPFGRSLHKEEEEWVVEQEEWSRDEEDILEDDRMKDDDWMLEEDYEDLTDEETYGTSLTRARYGPVIQEVQCKGIPKFKCRFIFDYDHRYCETVSNLRAVKCNHRKNLKRCPVSIETKEGCKIDFTVTNKEAKMLTSPKVKISGGPKREGFMSKCVCMAPLVFTG